MSKLSQKEKVEFLLSLHTCGDLLVLPNVWNPIDARILVDGTAYLFLANTSRPSGKAYKDLPHFPDCRDIHSLCPMEYLQV